MSIPRWSPSKTYTKQEEFLLRRLKRYRKLYAFLRRHRMEIFDDEFQDELASMYRDTGAGKCPVPPALLGMAVLLQGYESASDAGAVELTVVDLRWQMVLGCLGANEAAFSQGALHDFRHRMIRHDMDRRLLERTVEVARRTKGFDPKKLPAILRIAVDSAPLEGAGRVEDTINLLARAARKIVVCAAELSGRKPDALCKEAGIPLLLASSVKRGLDRVWTAPGERAAAVAELVEQVESLRRWLRLEFDQRLERPPLHQHMQVLQQIIDQDLDPDPDDGGPRGIRRGVAKDRRISIEDADMRHGRKSKTRRIDGYKRHVAKDLDADLIVACAVAPANEPERQALQPINDEIEARGQAVQELSIDRAYLSSPVVAAITARGGEILCKPWLPKNGELFAKHDFDINIDAMTITCPAGQTRPIRLGFSAEFEPRACERCDLRPRCTKAKPERGRAVHIAPDEPLLQKLRRDAATAEGRHRLRRRVAIEHALAHVVQRQGHRARYLGTRNNLFELRRTCAIQNLETAQRAAA